MKFKSILFTAASLFLLSSFTHATIIYDESIDGDAANTTWEVLGGADVGTLSTGSSVILGTGIGTFENSCCDFDDYIFTVNVGTAVNSIVFEVFDTLNNYGAELYTGDTLLTSSYFSDFGPSIFSAFDDAMSLGAGTYRINHAMVPSSLSDFDYSWTINVTDVSVSEVPEPSIFTIVCFAFIGLCFSRRKMLHRL